MDIGVGLPTTLPGAEAADLPDWAREAEALGFAGLGVLDRLVLPSQEPLVALAAAAAVTERIGLRTTILIAAYRGDTALLAKQLAGVQQLSRGRLAVGLAAGGRADDFEVSGQPFAGRGRRLDALIAELRRRWAQEDALVPVSPYGPPPLLIGGHSAAAMRRAARSGDGWIMGGASAVPYADLVARLRELWAEQGRAGRPRLTAIAHVALGPGAREEAEGYLRGFYAHAGPHAERVVRGLLHDETALRQAAEAYRAAGCDELVLFPCVADPEQLRLVHKALSPGWSGRT
jgi:alkanesulfonate monooxygenase SsuD/methylene tetrahydromethanopterin reductase-like flavin-dependent oxidoreductase (luciferase family)